MQFTKPFKQAIAAGEITTTFRTWRKPQARTGGQYNIPPYGAVEVVHVRKLEALALTESLETGYRLSPLGEQVLERRP